MAKCICLSATTSESKVGSLENKVFLRPQIANFKYHGVDYKARQRVIYLLVTRPFATQRDVLQALSRVGKYNDRCERLRFVGFEIIDRQLEIQML